MTTKQLQKNSAKTPTLRFAGFGGIWEEKKLGKIATFAKGRGISKDDAVENGKYKCIRYGELYTQYREIINEVYSRTNILPVDSFLSQKDDVIIPASGETALDIATTSCVKEPGILLGGDINVLRFNKEQNGDFLAYYLKNFKNRDIARFAQGQSVVHLYSSQLKELVLNTPTLPEQQKIAEFLMVVDEWVKDAREQEESLKVYKKGLIQKLFSREIRFKDKSGKDFPAWEKKRLLEISEKKASTVSANVLMNHDGQYKIYGAGGFLKRVDFFIEDEPYVSIVKDGAGVGRLLLCEENSSVLGTLDIIKPKKGVALYFLYSSLGRINFLKYITGGAIPHIYFRDYKREKLEMPCYEEQEKIADFLASIDRLIESKQQQIAQSEQWKRGLIQGLFV